MSRKQQGVGIVEVMVSLVILALGMLGMMSMQLTSLQQSGNAFLRNQATTQGNDILDRIRSNSDEIDRYFGVTGSSLTDCLSWNGAAGGCTAKDLALDDLARWQENLAQQLPEGRGRVCRSDLKDDLPGVPDCEPPGSNFPVVVYIWWQSSREENAPPEQLTMAADI